MRYLGCRHSAIVAAATIRIDLGLFHVCRQIYDEARYILYSNNTFSFNTARNLRAFIHFLVQRGVDVNEAVRSLHVDLAHLNSDASGWTQAFKAVTQHMTRIKTLYINVDPRSNWSTSSDVIEKERSMRPVMNVLAMLGKALAKSAVIILSDRLLAGTPPNTIRSMRCWTMEERRLWVQEVKSAIQDVQLSGH